MLALGVSRLPRRRALARSCGGWRRAGPTLSRGETVPSSGGVPAGVEQSRGHHTSLRFQWRENSSHIIGIL